MNTDRITELINKLPLSLMLFAFLGYLGYDYYLFTHDDTSALAMKKKEVEQAIANNVKTQSKVKELDNFVKSLDQKRIEIRKLALTLQEMKSSVSERSDVPAFMKMAITEAKKVGLNVLSLKPGSSEDREFYAEQTYYLNFRGAYVQLLAFVDRLSNVSEIVQIENYSMRPIGSLYAKYVELEGLVEIKTFRYLGTRADKIGMDGDGSSSGTSGQSSAAGGEHK